MNAFNQLFDVADQKQTSVKEELFVPITNKIPDCLDINSFIADGFKKICTVKPSNSIKDNYKWYYTNIDPIMYSNHRSWVYFVVVDNEIVKCGETEQPLGIKSSKSKAYGYIQPKTGTTSRFGRLATQGCHDDMRMDTDYKIRRAIKERSDNKEITIELWALKCNTVSTTITINGAPTSLNLKLHKDAEKLYLNYFAVNGRLPNLNEGLA